MCDKDCRCYLESDGFKAYQDIEELIGQSTSEQAWALYFVSAGVVRENIAAAVMTHIARGNKALKATFPEPAQAERCGVPAWLLTD
ncbi:hypothetical protein HZF02_04225 [Pseudomonas yamanorum]|nr:hypothetical protein HZF02_04225 [Pseudomonas yamanorum]